ncbi:MAG: OsmC family protein [Candidatus Kapabacteria bacterium]|nr:OsmC family protein [Candidatus Kapabacteria bacterium]
MVKIEIEYLGDLMCEVTHSPSGNKFFTDAPLDNQGQARYISPTDLLAASIGSCVATIMGIKAKANNIEIKGMKILTFKEMINTPFRRVDKLTLEIIFPNKLDDKDYELLSNVVKVCPVTKSLLPEIELEYSFKYALEV